LRDTPRPITDVNPAVPGELARIVRRALAKDPERRYQTAKDLRNDLEELHDELAMSARAGVARDSGSAAVTSPPHVPHASEASSGRRSFPTVAIAVAVAGGIGIGALALLAGRVGRSRDTGVVPTSAPAASMVDHLQITQLTTSGNAERPAI